MRDVSQHAQTLGHGRSVDVGKQRDPATIAITTAERHATPTGRSTVLWIVRSLEKLPLGTDYPRVADRIRDICFVLRERYTKPRFVYLDATGVGAAICDMLVERRVEHVPCTFVSGEKRTEHYPDTPKGVYISGGQPVERVSLGKGYAVGRLLGIMDNKRLKAPKSPIWPELRKELMAFELTATSMHDRYGASPGQHDDLITALALCVQADPPRTASIMPYQGVHVGEQPAAGRVWIPDRRNRSIHARARTA